MLPNHLTKSSTSLFCCSFLIACGGEQKRTNKNPFDASQQQAVETLRSSIKRAPNAIVISSNDIDWPVCSLPWDRFTLPVISPDGTHAAVLLGPSVPTSVLAGSDSTNLGHTIIELHPIDPVHGEKSEPIVVKQKGLLLGRNANDTGFLVEAPRGNAGRWIGRVDWDTGQLRWLISDDSTNAFPTLNRVGDLAWSRKLKGEDRFHIVLKTARAQRVIDDGESDWLMPSFAGRNRLFAYRLQNGSLSLVSIDLEARNPLLTLTSLLLMETGATKEHAWQIATTNPSNPNGTLAFYHPVHHRMTVWQPGNSMETVYLLQDSVAAAPVSDGSWIVSTSTRVIRQQLGADDGIYLRNKLAVPVATTSLKWTHLMLIPDGNRLDVHAMNLE
jgi:hypothetical protein